MTDFNSLKEIFISYKKFLITTHVNPDADAIGSQLAVKGILEKLGKEVFCINHSATPNNLKFLDTESSIQKFDSEIHKSLFDYVDVIICVDMNRPDRTVSMQNFIRESKAVKVVIDHHLDPDEFADFYFINTEFCATGQIVYTFVKETSISEIDIKTAEQLYAAIMTDTGSFRFDRTTPEVHKIAAELLSLGVNPNLVYDKLYDQSPFRKIKLLGAALESIKLYGKNLEVGCMIVDRGTILSTGAEESDTENFVNYTLSIEGVKIGLFFLELSDGFKVSLRSKGKIPVNKLAAEYGGGGHLNASGLRLRNKKMDDYIQEIINRAEFYLNEQ